MFFWGPIPCRDTFPVSLSRWKKLEAHCDNSESIRHSAVSKSDSLRLPELSFNRLQLTDQEYCGLERRNFGRFVAREAVLDEEYWVSLSLSLTFSPPAPPFFYLEQHAFLWCVLSVSVSNITFLIHCMSKVV